MQLLQCAQAAAVTAIHAVQNHAHQCASQFAAHHKTTALHHKTAAHHQDRCAHHNAHHLTAATSSLEDNESVGEILSCRFN